MDMPDHGNPGSISDQLRTQVATQIRDSRVRFASGVTRLDGPDSVVVLDYDKVADGDADLGESIREAFGFANLPAEVKARYEDPSTHYSFGWSHGKEKLEGKPDYGKGSYYNNPLHNAPMEGNEDLIKRFPSFYSANVWPTKDLPELEGAFMTLGGMICGVGFKLAAHCDKFVRSELEALATGGAGPVQWVQLAPSIASSRCCKARLLHYFPDMAADIPSDASQAELTDEQKLSSWCGWHNDHGSLTGLAGGGCYWGRDGNEVPPPSAQAGLYVKTRRGKIIRIAVPKDYMAFQIGETAQVHSGGILQATPHCVSTGGAAAGSKGVSRSTFAVFMEPDWNVPMAMPTGVREEGLLHPKDSQSLVPGVPPLATRWAAGQSFADFNDATLAAYY